MATQVPFTAEMAYAEFDRVARQVRGEPEPQAEPEPEWMTTESLAKWMDFPSIKAVRDWARRHDVPTYHRGRLLLFRRADVLRSVQAAGVVHSRNLLRRVR